MKKQAVFVLGILVGVLSAGLSGILFPTAAQGAILLDNGLDEGTPYTFVVSGTNQNSGGFTFFQPFTITDPAWEIETIGVAGHQAAWSDHSGMNGTLVPDLNGRPDEADHIASVSFFLPLDYSDWVDESIDITLSQGRYWVIFSARSPNSKSSLQQGTIGEGGFSRRGSDGAEFPKGASTLRITGQVIPEPATLLLLGLGAVMLRKRGV